MDDWKFADTLKKHARQASAEDVRRVRRRAQATAARANRRPHRAALWLAPALVAAALLAWWLQPQSPQLPEALRASADWAQASTQPGVQLQFRGEGQLANPSLVQWHDGQLRVEVEPGQDIEFGVRTDEALVRVVGTVFSVERSALGTSVSVERGKVEVTCNDSSPVLLVADGEHLCLRSAAAALGWALEQRQSGASPARILEVAQRGLALAPAAGPIHDELHVLRIEALNQLDRDEEALAAAEVYLAAATDLRRDEVRQIAARSALNSQGCEAALPHLDVLADQGAVVPLVLLADCLTQSDPARARAALERALAGDLAEEQRQAIEERLQGL